MNFVRRLHDAGITCSIAFDGPWRLPSKWETYVVRDRQNGIVGQTRAQTLAVRRTWTSAKLKNLVDRLVRMQYSAASAPLIPVT